MPAAPYKLIEFTSEVRGKKKSVDFVPGSWINFDMDLGGLVTKFMPPPYDEENSALLHSLIECRAPAPEDWTEYPIEIRGEATSYADAVKKLKVLSQREYAFSTDSEQTGKDKAVAAAKEYQSQRFSDRSEVSWEVPPLIEGHSPGYSSTNSEESSEPRNQRTRRKRSSIYTASRNTDRSAEKYKDWGKLTPQKHKVVTSGITSSQKNCSSKMPTKRKNNSDDRRPSSMTGTPKIREPEGPETMSPRTPGNSYDAHPTLQGYCTPNNRHNRLSSEESSSKRNQGARCIASLNKENNNAYASNATPTRGKFSSLGPIEERIDENNFNTSVLFDDLLPVINSQELSEELKLLIAKGFRSQSIQLTKISTQLEQLTLLVNERNIDKHGNINVNNLAEKWGLTLPIKTIEDFELFDEKLRSDEPFRDDATGSMWASVDSAVPISNSVKTVLKKFMSRDLTQQFTTVKNTGKRVLSKTKFYASVQTVIVAKYKENKTDITDKAFANAVGRVMNNAKDWEGHRAERSKTVNGNG